VFLKHGGTSLTHGPDAAAIGQVEATATARNPRCQSAANTNGDFGVTAIIAYASDDTLSKTIASFRDDIALMDGKLYEEAVESGSPSGADFIFRCDSAGAVSVAVEQLPTPMSSASFSTIAGDLRATGYTDSNAKYLVFYDSGINESYCGQGSIWPDESDAASNNNNSGNEYAINYNCSWSVNMHELAHNLGAVQYDAPHSTGTGWHCWQGQIYATDVMCYLDGGDKSPAALTPCPTVGFHFDCEHDDYFDAAIGQGAGATSGQYLDTHWNLGACYVRFLVNYACKAPTPPVITSFTRGLVAQTQLSSTQPTTVPVQLSWSATSTDGVCEYDLRQSTNGAAYTPVTIPSPTSKSVTLSLASGLTQTYAFELRARSCAGDWSAYRTNLPTFKVLAPPEDATPSVTYSSGWTRSASTGAVGGYTKHASTAGAWAQFIYSGTNLALVSPKSPTMGSAKVYIDGVLKTTISLYSSSVQTRRVVYKTGWFTSNPPYPPAATHKMKIVVVGTAGHPRIDIDAFGAIQ
jgi:hypothetical protein